MAGHSKWANIKHRKGAQDARKGKIFARLSKEIAVAVKTGGSDPESNPRLRLAIQNCRANNMPKDNIERAIKKAAGEGGANYQEVNYEGYGPGGVAIFVEAATDNITRTVGSIRHHFSKHGGSLGKDGCLSFVFQRKGIFLLKSENISDEEKFMEEMIDAGAEDVESEDGFITVTTAMEDFGSVQAKLQEINITPMEAGLERIPTNQEAVDADTWPKLQKLLNALEEDDDVQKVYHNTLFDPSVMK